MFEIRLHCSHFGSCMADSDSEASALVLSEDGEAEAAHQRLIGRARRDLAVWLAEDDEVNTASLPAAAVEHCLALGGGPAE